MTEELLQVWERTLVPCVLAGGLLLQHMLAER